MSTFERLRFVQGDVAYEVERRGDGPAVMLLHGFTGSVRTWDALASELARHHHVVAIDLLGHGDTDAPDDPHRYAMEPATADLAGLLGQLRIERASVLGYSMGGRLALGFAVSHPDRVAALVLESATAGIANESDRSARRASDERLAASIERDGVARFVAEWERLPLFATQARLPAARLAALRQDRHRHRKRGLANSLRGFGQGAQPALHARLAEINCPVLLVAGEEDAKFRGIAADLADRLSNARITIVPEAGHAVHFEQPERFTTIVLEFLQAAAPAGEGSI